jgi:quinol monooxygenase YgiN
MLKVALYVRLEAKPGREAEVEKFLASALPLVEKEPATAAWFALKLDKSTFAIFDAFSDEKGREAHLAGKIAAALMEKAPELLSKAPSIHKIDVVASRLAP